MTRSRTLRTAVIATLGTAAIVGIWAAVWVTGAEAHTSPGGMEYSAWCCKGDGMNGDCAPIPDSSVKIIAGGYQITLKPGDHPLVTRVHVFQIEQGKVHTSTDGRYHICLHPNEDTLRCFYASPGAA